MNTGVFAGVVATIILSNMLVAFWKRKDITFSVYAADPNKHNSLIIATSLTGTIVGGGMFIAVGQIGYEAGTAGYILGIIYLVSFVILGFLVKPIRQMMDEEDADTLLDLFGSTYGNRTTTQFCLVNLIMYIFLLAAQFVGLFLFARYIQTLTGILWLPWSLVSFAIVTIFLYPIIGGVRKDIRTDVIQLSVVCLASLILLYSIFNKGILTSMWVNLTPSHISGTGYGLVFIIGAIIFLPTSFIVRMDIWQRIRAAESETASKHAFWIAGIASCFFYLLFTTLGMWAYVLKLPMGSYCSLELINQQFKNPVLLGLIFGGFFAAVLSSADTFINNSSLFLTRIVFPKSWSQKNQNSTALFLLRRSRILGITLIILSLALASVIPNFVDLLVGAFSLLLIYFPPILGMFIPKWRDERAAFWAPNLGLLLFVILFFTWNPKIAFVPSVALSIIAFASIHLLTNPKPSNPSTSIPAQPVP